MQVIVSVFVTRTLPATFSDHNAAREKHDFTHELQPATVTDSWLISTV